MAQGLPVSSKQNKNTKRLNYALGFVTVAALFLGIWQLKNAIVSPFNLTNTGSNSVNNNTESSNDLTLLTKDTDSDGLSDFDEINVYKTSAYLKDTDSDGIDDKAEVEKGTDPNCPEGKSCDQVISGTSANPTDTNSTSISDMTPDEIRTLLKQNGLSDEVLSQYDDATLLSIYKEVAGEVVPTQSSTTETTADQSGTNGTSAPNLTDEQKQKILNLPVADLRQYLLDAGAEADVLQKIDDSMLQTLVKQVLGI